MNTSADQTMLKALTQWIAGHAPQLGNAISMRKFAAGQSNPSFLLECSHRSVVLRRKPAGELLASAHAVDREYRLIKALQDSAVPVPEAIESDTDAVWALWHDSVSSSNATLENVLGNTIPANL